MYDAWVILCRVVCILALCSLAGWVAWLTGGITGIGWAVIGCIVIWVYGQ